MAGAETRREHRDLHNLLLKDRHAESTFQCLLNVGARVGDGLDSLAPAQVRMHHAALNWARPHDRDFDHEIVELARSQARKHAHLSARLDLENAHCVGRADHVVCGFVYYAYQITDAPKWADNEQLRAAYSDLANDMAGKGQATLPVTLTNEGWKAAN